MASCPLKSNRTNRNTNRNRPSMSPILSVHRPANQQVTRGHSIGEPQEFELGLLRQRARAAFEQKVRRGFALWEVPVGFIRTEEGRIEKTPDRQVQQAITNVFHKFHQLGSARQATIWFREEQIPLPHAKL